MTVRNVHRREVDPVRVGPMIDSLSSEDDRLWPRRHWPAMQLDRPLQVGAIGGHGPIHYWVELYEPGRRVRFRFIRPRGFHGFHELHLVEGGDPELVHVLEMRLSGTARLTWPLVFRPLHDDLIEDALAGAAGQPPGADRPSAWSRQTRLLRRLLVRGRRAGRADVRPPREPVSTGNEG